MFDIDTTSFLCDMIDENLDRVTFSALVNAVPVFLESLGQFENNEQLTGTKREIPQKLFSIARYLAWNNTDIEQDILDTFPYREMVEIVMLSINCANWSKVTIASLECLINVLPIDRNPPISNIMTSPIVEILVDCLRPDSQYFQFQCYLVQLIGNLMSLDTDVNNFFCENGFLECVHASIGFPFAASALCASLKSVSGEKVGAFVELINRFLCQNDDRILIDGFRHLLMTFGESLVDISLVVERLPVWIGDSSNNMRVNSALALTSVLTTPPENVFEQVEMQLKDPQDVITHQLALDVLIKFHEYWRESVSEELICIMIDYANVLPYETAAACVSVLSLYGNNIPKAEIQREILTICVNYISDSVLCDQCMSAIRRILEGAAENGVLDEFLPIVEPEVESISAEDSEDAHAILGFLLE